MNQKLADLLEKKKTQAKDVDQVDWDDRRDRYLASVKALYDQIEAELAVPIGKKTVALYRRRKELSENYIGTYSIDDLILVVGIEQVRFSPRGRNVVGAAGRVDVVGERGEATLIFQLDSGWHVVQSRQPTVLTTPFDASTFADVLQLVMRA